MQVFLGLSAALALADAQPGPDLSWLTGHWQYGQEETVVEEFWTDMRGGLMLGGNRTLHAGRAVAFEHIRIVVGETTQYCAQPGGGAPVCFELTDHGDGFAVFENAEHDFPQRIAYRRDETTLSAEISDLSGAQSMGWSWERVD